LKHTDEVNKSLQYKIVMNLRSVGLIEGHVESICIGIAEESSIYAKKFAEELSYHNLCIKEKK
jgi:hypothetical protein